jgi:nucleoside-diphosphate-sugar epimerase
MLYDGYKGRNALIFGANSFVGKGVSEFLSQNHTNLGLIDLESYKDTRLAENLNDSQAKIIYKTVTSGDQLAFEEIAGVVGVSKAATRSRYRRAVERLHNRLSGESLGDDDDQS